MLPQAYTKLSIFKRIEVWILLALTAAGLAVVLLSTGPQDDPGDDDGRPPAGQADKDKPEQPPSPSAPAEFGHDGPLVIDEVDLTREGEHSYLVEVHFSFDNQRDAELRPVEQAKLITASGKSVPVFVLAFASFPPPLPAGQETASSMLFSLGAADVVGELTLDIAGSRAAVKSGRSFDPESLRERTTRTFKNLDW